MSIIKQIRDKELLIAVWKMDEPEVKLYELLGNSANSKRIREECNQKFSSDARKKEWLSVRVLLSQLLGENVVVAYRANGEPFLVDSEKKVSISHTRDYVAVAISTLYHVGIDIEIFSHRVDSIVDKIMIRAEKAPKKLDAESQTWHSLLVWSTKESVYKCLDIDTLDYKNGILISPFDLQSQGEMKAQYTNYNYHYMLYVHYRCMEDFVLTWCSEYDLNGC